jgi:CDP-diacylglycerol--glycerol-3-phosphate 3-phosphatidyltransferase
MRISLPRSAPKWVTDPVVRPLAKMGVTPNMLTVLGVVGNGAAGALCADGNFLYAGILLLASSALDMFDGALARATGQATPFGSAFDATMDRVSEAAVFFGLLVWESGQENRTEELLIFVAIVSSILVSYVRARAEILGLKMKEGFFTRFERVALMGIGLVAHDASGENFITPILWIIAVVASFTALQRLVIVWLRTRNEPPDDIAA